jgi:hypothetical protein
VVPAAALWMSVDFQAQIDLRVLVLIDIETIGRGPRSRSRRRKGAFVMGGGGQTDTGLCLFCAPVKV